MKPRAIKVPGESAINPLANYVGVQEVAISRIKPNPHNSRTHSKKQIRQIAESITAFGFANPLLLSEEDELIAGHGRYQAAKLLALQKVPVIVVAGLSSAKRRALAIADNKLAKNAAWDRGRLAIEIPELAGLLSAEGLDVSILGFEAVEIEQITDLEEHAAHARDKIDPTWWEAAAVSKLGDLWLLDHHKLLCGDSSSAEDTDRLMNGCRADLAFLDPPHNACIGGVGGRDKTNHAKFAIAGGEPSFADFVSFLRIALGAAAAVSRRGAVHFVGVDWRHISELMAAAKPIYGEALDLVVCVKSKAGQGSFYRSQYQLIGMFRVGSTHPNHAERGRPERLRSNVWRYAAVNSLRAGHLDELRADPKPIALVADAIKDCTRKGDVVLDTFSGSGTTIMAAERVGRHARALEIDPRLVDVAIRRWQAFTHRNAIHAESGLSFEQIAADRTLSGRMVATNKRSRRRQ